MIGDVAPDVTPAEWIGFALTLFMFFIAQAIALFFWYRSHTAAQRREAVRNEERQEKKQEEQLTRLQSIVDKDIGVVRDEVADVRNELHQQERIQTQRNEQLHGHMRRIEDSRPTRDEMEKNMAQLNELVLATKADLEKAVNTGFQHLDRRFDEFKEYTRDLWNGPRGGGG